MKILAKLLSLGTLFRIHLINAERRLHTRLVAEAIDEEIKLAIAEAEELVYDSVPLGEAKFIQGEKYLLASCTSEQYKQPEVTGRPVKLGYFTKEGWSGGLPFYLFKCPSCQVIGVDYKHGFRPYLYCEDCKISVTFGFFTQSSKKRSA